MRGRTGNAPAGHLISVSFVVPPMVSASMMRGLRARVLRGAYLISAMRLHESLTTHTAIYVKDAIALMLRYQLHTKINCQGKNRRGCTKTDKSYHDSCE
eukprot:1786910-Pyramimonas_sp.AAC.1